MTRFFKPRILAPMVLAFVCSCGNKDEAKDFEGQVGSCTYSTGKGDAKVTVCIDHSISGKSKSNLADSAKSDLEKACKDSFSDGVYSVGGTCSTAGATGYCNVTSGATKGSESYTVTAKIVMIGTLVTAQMAENSCTKTSGGVWQKIQ